MLLFRWELFHVLPVPVRLWGQAPRPYLTVKVFLDAPGHSDSDNMVTVK